MHADYIIDEQFTDIIYSENDIKFKEYENCTFTKCNFTACSFTAVTFIDCNFFDCNFTENTLHKHKKRECSD